MHDADAADILFAHHAGRTTAFSRAHPSARSRFGGSTSLRCSGAAFGPRPLHQVAYVALGDIGPLPFTKPYAGLPLLYGLCFDGCDLAYRVSADGIDVQFITPDRSCDDWPYEDYPIDLPLVPLAPSRSWLESWADFRASVIPGLTERESATLTFVLPTPRAAGVSLWGCDGDDAGVALVFQYSHERDLVRAFNVCP